MRWRTKPSDHEDEDGDGEVAEPGEEGWLLLAMSPKKRPARRKARAQRSEPAEVVEQEARVGHAGLAGDGGGDGGEAGDELGEEQGPAPRRVK